MEMFFSSTLNAHMLFQGTNASESFVAQFTVHTYSNLTSYLRKGKKDKNSAISEKEEKDLQDKEEKAVSDQEKARKKYSDKEENAQQ